MPVDRVVTTAARGLHVCISCRDKTVLRRGPAIDPLLNTLYPSTEEVIITKATIYH